VSYRLYSSCHHSITYFHFNRALATTRCPEPETRKQQSDFILNDPCMIYTYCLMYIHTYNNNNILKTRMNDEMLSFKSRKSQVWTLVITALTPLYSVWCMYVSSVCVCAHARACVHVCTCVCVSIYDCCKYITLNEQILHLSVKTFWLLEIFFHMKKYMWYITWKTNQWYYSPDGQKPQLIQFHSLK
jgi:hypothetical protein